MYTIMYMEIDLFLILDPKDGTPRMGPKDGPQEWTPRMDPKDGTERIQYVHDVVSTLYQRQCDIECLLGRNAATYAPFVILLYK